MRYGAMMDGSRPLDEVVGQVASFQQAGFEAAWSSQIFGFDALTLLAIVGREVPGIGLGTAVVPIYPRHPITLAGQALTVQAATNGRLNLGIGLSHQVVIEGMYGYSFDRPVRRMREYLSILEPLLHGEQVNIHGETVTAVTVRRLDVDAPAPPVLLAALAPAMLRLAGTAADGTITWMTGPKTVKEHIVPSINEAAAGAGRPVPRVVCALPVCVTADPDAARDAAGRTFAIYGQLPSYQAMLAREGAQGPADVALVGSGRQVAEAIDKVEEAGATEFVSILYGSREDQARTLDFLAERVRS